MKPSASSASSSFSKNDPKATPQKLQVVKDSFDDDSCSEEETEQVNAFIKPPASTPTSKLKPVSESGSESGSESESESESDSKPESETTPPSATTKRALEKEEEKGGKKMKTVADDCSDCETEEKDSKVSLAIADDGSDCEKEEEKDGKKKKMSPHRLFREEDEKVEEKTVKNVDKHLCLTEIVRFGDEIEFNRLNLPAMKRGMELIGEAEKAMFREKEKKIHIAQMKILMVRAELIRDQTSTILEAYENSN